MSSIRMILLASCLSFAACGSDDSNKEGGDGDTGDGDGDGTDGDGSDGDGDGDGTVGDGDGGDGDGSAIPEGNCDTRHCYAAELHTCFQWSADDEAHVELCDGFNGVVADGACPSDDRVAGCKTASPFGGDGCAINWAYQPLTEDDVSSTCSGQLITQ